MQLHVFIVGQLQNAKGHLGKRRKAEMRPGRSDRLITSPPIQQHRSLPLFCESANARGIFAITRTHDQRFARQRKMLSKYLFGMGRESFRGPVLNE